MLPCDDTKNKNKKWDSKQDRLWIDDHGKERGERLNHPCALNKLVGEHELVPVSKVSHYENEIVI